MKFHSDPVTASVFTAARCMPLVFVCVFLNDSSAVLDTEMTEYHYISLFYFGTFDFACICTHFSLVLWQFDEVLSAMN